VNNTEIQESRRNLEDEVFVLLDDICLLQLVLSQFVQNLCIDHWNGIIHILRYLKMAPRVELLYEDKGNAQIFGYCDVDWVGSLMDRRFIIGYCVLLGGNVISWKIKK